MIRIGDANAIMSLIFSNGMFAAYFTLVPSEKQF